MKLLRLTLRNGKTCYINPDYIQYFESVTEQVDDGSEETQVVLIGGKVAVTEEAETIANKLKWIEVG